MKRLLKYAAIFVISSLGIPMVTVYFGDIFGRMGIIFQALL